MFQKHVSKDLSAYCNGELSAEESRSVGEHLLNCRRCRLEYEQIKFGVHLAQRLPEVSAPDALWSEIEATLEGSQNPNAPRHANGFAFFFDRYRMAAAVTAALLLLAIALTWYYSRRPDIGREHAGGDPPAPVVPEDQQRKETPLPAPPFDSPDVPKSLPPRTPQPKGEMTPRPYVAWNVDSLQGEPKVDSVSIKGKGRLGVGSWLETDAHSRAKIDVADIGQVEVDPNSRIQLLRTRATEHRLALARGTMHARILAPPRLFFVNTPSAVAIDYGCVYTLTVDEMGGSRLDVETGWVKLASHGRESIVPAGGTCITRRGHGPGTPYFGDASDLFLAMLTRFDFENGGNRALTTLLTEARERDTLTLIHLLHRVTGKDRRLVYDRLADIAPPPAGVTRAGVLSLDPSMLEEWMRKLTWLW